LPRNILALPALILAAVPAVAAAQATDAQEIATKAELQKSLDSNYARMDTDKNGALSRTEVQSAQATASQQAQQVIGQQVEAEFAKLDSNKDGQISLAEFKTAAPKARTGSVDQFLQRFDSNKDGTVAPAEYKAPALAAFDRFDTNKDGTVSPQERQAISR
jgi:Ca2+-binding EF-hand superfamily protein